MKIEIKHRYTEKVIYTGKESIKATLIKAVGEGADLEGADLRGADLRGADLRDADLRGAYLRGADLEGADLRGADLEGADLRGAYLRGAKQYHNSHDFFMELIRKEKIETFKTTEWSIIGQISIHRLCWDAIKKRFGKKVLRIGKVLADRGFKEYLEYYKK